MAMMQSKKEQITVTLPETPPKRNTKPGIRVVGGRIYDSEKGKSCHQCRQKTMDFTASCKNQVKNKSCTIKFCHKCLLNRYGENAEVEDSGDWRCPKCRSICNCSLCMKKKGCEPTGILVLKAKARGFTSVYAMLHDEHSGNTRETQLSTDKKPIQNQDSSSKPGKENHLQFASVNNSSPKVLPRDYKKKKLEIPSTILINSEIDKKQNHPYSQQQKNKIEISSPAQSTVPESDTKENSQPVLKKKGRKRGKQNQADVNESRSIPVTEASQKYKRMRADATSLMKSETPETMDVVHPPPLKTQLWKTQIDNCKVNLTFVSGIEVSHEDAGNAVQFMEFCSTFTEVLKLKKGEGECVLRELMSVRGRRVKRAQYCPVSRFCSQLVSLMKEGGEVAEWECAVQKCVSECCWAPEELSSKLHGHGRHAYYSLTSSEKLKLLNFLCDEILSTSEMRTWIDSQNEGFIASKREIRERVAAARQKERSMKRKLQGFSGAVECGQLRKEAGEAHAELMDLLSTDKKESSNCVRTRALALDGSGRAFWRLDSSHTDLLIQDFGNSDGPLLVDRWFAHATSSSDVERYLAWLRHERGRVRRRARKCRHGDVIYKEDPSSVTVVKLEAEE